MDSGPIILELMQLNKTPSIILIVKSCPLSIILLFTFFLKSRYTWQICLAQRSIILKTPIISGAIFSSFEASTKMLIYYTDCKILPTAHHIIYSLFPNMRLAVANICLAQGWSFLSCPHFLLPFLKNATFLLSFLKICLRQRLSFKFTPPSAAGMHFRTAIFQQIVIWSLLFIKKKKQKSRLRRRGLPSAMTIAIRTFEFTRLRRGVIWVALSTC